jgi:hypothetical protein
MWVQKLFLSVARRRCRIRRRPIEGADDDRARVRTRAVLGCSYAVRCWATTPLLASVTAGHRRELAPLIADAYGFAGGRGHRRRLDGALVARLLLVSAGVVDRPEILLVEPDQTDRSGSLDQ